MWSARRGCSNAVPSAPHRHSVQSSSLSSRECVADAAFFLGGAPRLKHKELISSSTDRFRLHTEPAGDVLIRLNVLPKDFARYGVLC